MCDTQIAQRGCDLSGNISLRPGGQLQICWVSSRRTSLESRCEVIGSVSEHAADAPYRHFRFYLYFTGKNIKFHINTLFFLNLWRLRSSSSRAVADNRINTCSFHPFYWWLLLLKEACALWCFLETVKRLCHRLAVIFAVWWRRVLHDSPLPRPSATPAPPLSGRRFLMLGSGADTFWGKGFLATALGTASPDRKKTHRGQKVWTPSGSERERESQHMWKA